jgi:hypothetical protein
MHQDLSQLFSAVRACDLESAAEEALPAMQAALDEQGRRGDADSAAQLLSCVCDALLDGGPNGMVRAWCHR